MVMKNKHLQDVKLTAFHNAEAHPKIVLLRNIGRFVRSKGTLCLRFLQGRKR
jgi:hypothetical protein